MFALGLSFILFFALCGAIQAQSEATADQNCTERCPLRFRCNIYHSGPHVWSVVDGVCKVFQNNCLFSNSKCNRRNECLSDIEKTTRDECKKRCVSDCESQMKQPVCAFYADLLADGTTRDESITYASQCELDRQTCLSERPYISASEGACIP